LKHNILKFNLDI